MDGWGEEQGQGRVESRQFVFRFGLVRRRRVEFRWDGRGLRCWAGRTQLVIQARIV